MFKARQFLARQFNALQFGASGAAPVVPTGSKGRRLVRWVINSPWIPSPVAEWVRAREDEEELFILG